MTKCLSMAKDRYCFESPLMAGRLLRRYKRFLADIELDSQETITAHCPNTGPMSGVCELGSPVQVSYHSDPKRKLAYTWEMIQVGSTWVGINTALPNRLVQFGLNQGWFPELTGFTGLRREVAYGTRSKVDILLSYADGRPDTYVEIKNTTWCHGSLALFPDTATPRGQKHIQELERIAQTGQRAVMFYVINRGDCDAFAPGDQRDPVYGQLLRQAVTQGLEILPYRFGVDPAGISCLGLAKLHLDQDPVQ